MPNSQNRFSFVRLLTFGGIAFLLLGLLLSSSAQADTISAVRVNALNGATYYNLYSNANFSVGNTSQFCTEQSNGSNAYIFTNDTNDYTPVVLCDLGAVHTINSLDVTAYSVAGNSVKGMKIEFYDTPALSGTPVHTQEFTVAKTGKTTLNLDSSVQARYARITMTSNYGGDRVGVGDVMFNVENYLKTPTSSSMNSSEVATHSGYSVNYLYVMDASKQWCSNSADTTNGYFNGTNKNPVFTFNYDTPVTLSSVFIQTYSSNGNSLKDFQLDIFDSAGNQYTHNYTMTDCNYGVQNAFSFPEVENVTSVQMTVSSNFRRIAPGGGDRIGVGGVYFSNLELDLPTTPEKYNASLRADNIIVRPTNATFVTEGSARASDCSVSFLYDGTGTGCGSKAWYTKSIGSEKDYYNRGYAPIIDLTFPKDTYDSFSVWGYNSAGNQLTDFILELLNDGQVVYAEEFQIDQRIKSASYATFSLGGNYLFDTARMTLLDNAFARFVNDGGDRVGFAEIAFYQEPYYFANSPDASDETWTIDGTTKKGVQLTDNGEQTATFENLIVLNADGTVEVGEEKTLTISGSISGNNGLEKIGAGTLTLSGANTYTGETTVAEGTLQLTGDGVQTSGPITVDTNGTLEFNIQGGQTEKATITADNAIDSDGKVIKTGEGTLKIDSAEGAVDVQSLVVSSGRLDMKTYFKGTLIIGEELEEGVYTTATFSPGNSIDTLTIDGDFVLNPGSTLLMEIGGQSADENDKLIVSGDFEIADDAIIYLALADMGAFTNGDAFEALIQAGTADDDFTDAISNAIVPGWPFYDWSVNKSGNEYYIRGVYDPNAVPEPSTWALMVLGAAGLMYWRKRK